MSETDEIDARLDALGKGHEQLWDAIAELQDENQQLRDRISELENIVVTDIDALDYEAKSKADKIREIHQYLVDQAGDSATDKAAADYKEVRALFNGQASPGHAYDLMDAAGEAAGFTYEERDGHTNRLTINLDAVKETGVFRSANKTTRETTQS